MHERDRLRTQETIHQITPENAPIEAALQPFIQSLQENIKSGQDPKIEGETFVTSGGYDEDSMSGVGEPSAYSELSINGITLIDPIIYGSWSHGEWPEVVVKYFGLDIAKRSLQENVWEHWTSEQRQSFTERVAAMLPEMPTRWPQINPVVSRKVSPSVSSPQWSFGKKVVYFFLEDPETSHLTLYGAPPYPAGFRYNNDNKRVVPLETAQQLIQNIITRLDKEIEELLASRKDYIRASSALPRRHRNFWEEVLRRITLAPSEAAQELQVKVDAANQYKQEQATLAPEARRLLHVVAQRINDLDYVASGYSENEYSHLVERIKEADTLIQNGESQKAIQIVKQLQWGLDEQAQRLEQYRTLFHTISDTIQRLEQDVTYALSKPSTDTYYQNKLKSEWAPSQAILAAAKKGPYELLHSNLENISTHQIQDALKRVQRTQPRRGEMLSSAIIEDVTPQQQQELRSRLDYIDTLIQFGAKFLQTEKGAGGTPQHAIIEMKHLLQKTPRQLEGFRFALNAAQIPGTVLTEIAAVHDRVEKVVEGVCEKRISGFTPDRLQQYRTLWEAFPSAIDAHDDAQEYIREGMVSKPDLLQAIQTELSQSIDSILRGERIQLDAVIDKALAHAS